MHKPRLLADMNVSPETVTGLRGAGYDAVRVCDLVSPRSPDPIVMDLAEREGRVLVSHDLDFSALLALQGRTRPSLVTIRLHSSDPLGTLHRLVTVLPRVVEALATGAAVTVDEVNVRVRRLPID